MTTKSRNLSSLILLAALLWGLAIYAIRVSVTSFLRKRQVEALSAALSEMPFDVLDLAFGKHFENKTKKGEEELAFFEKLVNQDSDLAFYTSGTTMIRVEYRSNDVRAVVVSNLEYK
ncbi:MAG TPA: hypothetical protein PKM67_09995 [Kiritimatiellia bacterium]|nr:hypothetical protein [Kiritimatiellia bacterium]